MRRATALASGILALGIRALGLLALGILVTLLTGVIAVAVRAGGEQSPSVGQLASLLAHRHSQTITRAVAAESRATLSAEHLQSTWDAMTRTTGPLREVTKTIVVREAGSSRDEIELLRFSGGYVATLAAHRQGHEITALELLGGTADQAAAAVAGQYALDLVGGRFTTVQAKFDAQMSSLLSLGQLTAQTAEATVGLQRPAQIAAQVVVAGPAYTVVETYLVFPNGIRRIETTFGADGTIAGLYIRPL
jgi:hypothetical protein